MKKDKSSQLTQGEAVIRRAFLYSLAVVGVFALGGALMFWAHHRAQGPAPQVDAQVQAPRVVAPPAGDAPPAVQFTDITRAAGIGFIHTNGAYGERLMPETIGSGAAFVDYDHDGCQDLVLVNSRYWEGHEGGRPQPRQAIYRNDCRGRFTDVTDKAGLGFTAYGMGVAVGDYDGDGWDDLYVTGLHGNHLFRNDHGHFVDVTDQAGVGGDKDTWSSSAAFFDYDNDGQLDLFVVNYVKWSRQIDLDIDFRLTGLGRAYGAPVNFIGTNSVLYHNDGNGRFSDVSTKAGIQVLDPVSGRPVGKGLGVVPVDYDGDGHIDLMVVNDTVRNFLFHNKGDGSFEEAGVFEGVAYDGTGKATSSMGVDAAHYRDDKDLGMAVGNFANEMASLYVTSNGRPPFVDEGVLEGLGPSRIPLTFGLLFLDYDLDGRLDLLLANGHLESEIHKVQQSQTYAQPSQLYWNCGPSCPSRYVFVAKTGDLSEPLVGRGIAYADIDGDGDLDLLVTQNGRRPALFRNDQKTGHHWLRVKLKGRPPNTDAIGARLALTAGGVTRYREVMPSRGYLSQVELPVTFGLGPLDRVESLHIVWPDGSTQDLAPNAVDTSLVIEQDAGGGR